MSIKLYLVLVFSLICNYFSKLIVSNDKAGVKIAASQHLILDFQKKYLPILLSQIGHISVPDQRIDVDAKIGTLHIDLTQISIDIKTIQTENIQVSFGEPNFVTVSANQISGNGQFKVRFKLGFISETDRVEVKVKKADVSVSVELSATESHKVSGKFIPTASITSININLDFDFEIHGRIIAAIADLVKSKIKSIINDQIQNNLKSQIIQKVNQIIKESIDKLPVYIPIGKYDLAVDYSLVSAPKIINNYLILNSNGAVVNLNNKESLENPFTLPDNLPDYDTEGKLAQVFFSDYSLNTAFRTLHLTKLLKIKVESSDIPSDSPVQLNTTSLDLIINGLSDVYGKEKLVEIFCETFGLPPQVTLLESETEAQVNGVCSIFVEVYNNATNSTNFEKALEFNTTITASADAVLFEGGNITARINKIHLENSMIVFSNVPKADIKSVERLFNFSSNLIIPFINSKYLKYLTISLPSVDGIYFNDSKLDIKTQYIEVNLTPVVTVSQAVEIKKHKKEFKLDMIYLGY